MMFEIGCKMGQAKPAIRTGPNYQAKLSWGESLPSSCVVSPVKLRGLSRQVAWSLPSSCVVSPVKLRGLSRQVACSLRRMDFTHLGNNKLINSKIEYPNKPSF